MYRKNQYLQLKIVIQMSEQKQKKILQIWDTHELEFIEIQLKYIIKYVLVQCLYINLIESNSFGIQRKFDKLFYQFYQERKCLYICSIFIRNKLDFLNMRVSTMKSKNLALQQNILYIEITAIDNNNMCKTTKYIYIRRYFQYIEQRLRKEKCLIKYTSNIWNNQFKLES
ncbi:unnamed protein product [Paramecium primaurelia]|uniref:Uncharacterized protein n=1 Tax=Paramecium primaurelia TaxID=5886 RepID=A0A8S1KXW6_PARPR|nr:unnamed protein product [Paramecium primaurelia]